MIAVLAGMACLLSTASALAPDTLWAKRLDLGDNESGYGIALRGNAMAVAGSAWTGMSSDMLVVRMNQDGDTIWTRTRDGGADDGASSVCLDAESNALLAGFSMGIEAADVPGPLPADALSRIRNRIIDAQEEVAYTAKYDSLGVLQWFRADKGHMALGIAADSAGNCYVFGAVNTGAGYDLWLAKLNSSGDTIWTRTLDLAGLEIGYRLAIEPSGNLAGCAYIGNMEDFDCLTLRFTPDGDTLWTRRFSDGPDDAGNAVAVDPHGNIIVVGRTMQGATYDALVLKYDSSGALLWNRRYDTSTDEGLLGVACDAAGDVYATGYTGLDFSHDCLTMKLDASGDTLWTAAYGGATEDQASDVACDAEGNPVIAGYVSDTLGSGYDVLTLKYGTLTGVAESPHRPKPAVARTTITAAPYFVLAVPSSGRYDIRLCDLTGRTRQQVFSGHLNEGAHRLSLAGQPAGSYFVRVAAPDGGISCQRLVLMK
jgi:hypothetical protein